MRAAKAFVSPYSTGTEESLLTATLLNVVPIASSLGPAAGGLPLPQVSHVVRVGRLGMWCGWAGRACGVSAQARHVVPVGLCRLTEADMCRAGLDYKAFCATPQLHT